MIKGKRLAVLAAAAGAAMGMWAGQAKADQTWTGATSANWDDANWTTAVPTAADIVTLPTPVPGSFGSAITLGTSNPSESVLSLIINNNYTLTGGTLNIAGASAGTTDVTLGTGVTATINSIIAGSNGLNITGGGTLRVSGGSANTYTGGTSIVGGATLGFTAANLIGGGNITLGNATTLGTLSYAVNGTDSVSNNVVLGGAGTTSATNVVNVADAGATLTLAGNISGGPATVTNLAVRKTGAGKLVLAGTNTFTGHFSIDQGVVQVPTIGATLGALTGAANAIIDINGGTLKVMNSVTTGEGTAGYQLGAFNPQNAHAINVTSAGGTIDLSNGYTGALGSGVTMSWAREEDALKGTGTLTINSGKFYYAQSQNSRQMSFSGNLILQNGAIFGFAERNTQPQVFAGSGTLTLNTNTAIRLDSTKANTAPLGKSIVVAGDSKVIMRANTGTLSVTATELQGATLTVLGSTVNDVNGANSPGIGGTFAMNNVSLASNGILNIDNLNTLEGTQSSNSTLATAAIISDKSGTGTHALNKVGPGTLQIKGAGTYGGGTNIYGGTIQLGVANALPGSATTGATVNIGSASGIALNGTTYGVDQTALLDLNGFGTTIAVLAEAGTASKHTISNNSTTAATVTFNNASTITFAGAITGKTTSTADPSRTLVVKNNTGALLLNGASTYTGATTINNGTLGGSGTLASAVTIIGSTGGNLAPGFGLTTPTTFTLNGGLTLNAATLNFNFGSYAGGAGLADLATSTTAGLTLTGTNTLNIATLSGFPTSGVASAVFYPVLKFASTSGTGTLVLGTQPTVTGETLSLVQSGGEWDLKIMPAGVQHLRWTGQTSGSNDGVWSTSSGNANWYNTDSSSTAPYADGNEVTFSDSNSGATTIIPTGTLSPGAITFNNSSLAYTLDNTSSGGGITGAVGITKNGTNSLTIKGNYSFSLPVAINAGTIIINGSGLPNGSVSSSSLGTASSLSLGDASNTGTLRITDSGSYSTDRAVSIGAGGGAIEIASADGSVNASGLFTGSATFTKRGPGSLTLSNTANLLSGSLVVDQGTLSVASMGTGGASTTITPGVSGAGDFEYTGSTSFSDTRGLVLNSFGSGSATVGVTNSAATLTLASGVSGSGALTKSGSGTLALSGGGTLSSVNINSGTLNLSGVSATTVGGNGNLTISGSSAVSVGGFSSYGAILITSTGTTTLSGTFTNSNGMTVTPTSTGTINSSASISGIGVTLNSGATFNNTGAMSTTVAINSGATFNANAGGSLVGTATVAAGGTLNANAAGVLNGATINVTGGTATFTGAGAAHSPASMSITGGVAQITGSGAQLNPTGGITVGAAGTFLSNAGAGNSASVTTGGSFTNDGMLHVQSGTLNMGGTIITTNRPTPTLTSNALVETWYNFNPTTPGDTQITLSNASASILNASPGASRNLTGALNYGTNTAMNTAAGGSLLSAGVNYCGLWTGTMSVGGANMPAGTYTFGTYSDDGSALYIDLNQDGAFQSSELVVSNLGAHGGTTQVGTKTLTAGTYKIGIAYDQQGGGGNMEAGFAPGTVAQGNFTLGGTATTGYIINPTASSPSQSGIWTAVAPGGQIAVDAGATLRVGGFMADAVTLNGTSTSIGTLTLPDAASTTFSTANTLTALGTSAVTHVNVGNNQSLRINNLVVPSGVSLRVGGGTAGNGTTTLATSSSIAGTLHVDAGTLIVNSTGDTNTGAVAIHNGATLGGHGTITGPVTLDANATLAPSAGSLSSSTLTTGGLTLVLGDHNVAGTSSILNFNIGDQPGLADCITVHNTGGTAAFATTGSGQFILNVNPLGSFSAGLYKIILADTSTVPTSAFYLPVTSIDGYNLNIVKQGAGEYDLNVVLPSVTRTWYGGHTNSTWSANSGDVNWSADGGSNFTAFSNGDSAVLDNSSSGTITLSGAIGLGAYGLAVNNDAGHNYTIDGTSGTLSGLGAGLTKDGAGSLTISGGHTFTGAAAINNGTVSVNALADGGSASPLGAGSSITLGDATNHGTLQYTGASAGSMNRAVTVLAGGGTVDVGAAGVTLSGVVGGAGTLTKAGAGDLNLSSSGNSFTGSLTVLQGTLSASSIGAGTAGTLITLGDGTNTATYHYAGPTIVSGRGLTVATSGSTFQNDNAVTLNGALSGGTLNKNGGGALTLGGTGSLGGLNMNGGNLTVSGGATINNLVGSGGNLTVSNGTINATGGSFNTANISAGNANLAGATVGTANLTGGTVTTGAGTVTITTQYKTASYTFNVTGGSLQASGTNLVNDSTARTLTLSSGSTLQIVGPPNTIGVHFVGGNGAVAIPSGTSAGASPYATTNWFNFTGTSLGAQNGNLGAATLTSYTANTTYGTGSSVQLLNGYIDNTGGGESVVISNIAYPTYSVIAYFGSDATGRTGSVSIGSTTYYYSTMGNVTTYTQTTSTTSGTNPSANFAIFSNLTGSTFTLNQVRGSDNSGLHGLEILGPSSSSLLNTNVVVPASASLDLGGGSAILGALTLNNSGTQLTQTNANSAGVTYSSITANATSSITGGTRTYVANGGSITVAGGATFTPDALSVASGASVTMNPGAAGTGRMNLSNAAIGGTLTVAAGTLSFDGANTGSGTVNVSSGSTLRGGGSFAGAVSVAAGAHVAPSSGTTTASTLTLGSLTLTNSSTTPSNNSILDLNFGAPDAGHANNDFIQVNGNLSPSNANSNQIVLNVNNLTGLGAGTYPFLAATGTISTSLTAGSFFLPVTTIDGYVLSVKKNGSEFDLKVALPSIQRTWYGTDGQTWSTSPADSHWSTDGGATLTGFSAADSAILGNNSSGTVVLSGSIELGAHGLTVNNDLAHAYTIDGTAGTLTGDAGLTKNGAGTIAIGGSHTFTGDVAINQGAVSVGALADKLAASPIGAGNSIGLGDLANAGTLQYTGGSAGSTNRDITVSAGGGTLDTGVGATFSGVISGAGNLTVKQLSTSTTTLSNIANALTGSIMIQQGTLQAASLGAGASGKQIVVGDGTGGAASLVYTGTTASYAGGLNLGTGSSVRVSTSGQILTFAQDGNATGTLSVLGAGALAISGNATVGAIDNQAAGLTIGGNLMATTGDLRNRGGTLTVTGTSLVAGNILAQSGTTTLTGAATVYGADHQVSAGATLNLPNTSNSIGGTIAVGGTLRVSGSGTNTGLSGAAVNLTGGSLSLLNGATYANAVSVDASSSTSAIQAAAAGTVLGDSSHGITMNNALALQPASGVDLTIAGPVTGNGHTMTVSSGKVYINSAADALSVSVSSGATLGGSGTIAGSTVTINSGAHLAPHTSSSGASVLNIGTGLSTATLTLADGAVMDFNLGTAADQVAVNGTVSLNGSETLNVARETGFGIGTYDLITSTSAINRSALSLGVNIPGLSTLLTYKVLTPADAGYNADKLTLQVLDNSLVWTGNVQNADTTFHVSDTNWLDANGATVAYVAGRAISFGDTASNRNVNFDSAISPLAVTVNNSTGHDYTFSGAGAISGAGTLNKNGTGTLFVNNANGYTGGTTINAGGTVSAGVSGALGTGSISIDNATLTASQDATLINAITISTSGASLGAAAGKTLTLSGVISGGNPALTTPYTGTPIVAANTVLIKTGDGTVVLSSANSFVGNIVLSAGTLQISGNNQLGSTTTSTADPDPGNGTRAWYNNQVIFNGGTLRVTSSVDFSNRQFVFNDGTTSILSIAGGQTVTLGSDDNPRFVTSHELSGTGNLIVTGGGTVQFGTNNGTSNTLWTGNLDVEGGSTLHINAKYGGAGVGATGTLTFHDGTTFQFDNSKGLSGWSRPIAANGMVTFKGSQNTTGYYFAGLSVAAESGNQLLTVTGDGGTNTSAVFGATTLNTNAVFNVTPDSGGKNVLFSVGAIGDGGHGYSMTKVGTVGMWMNAASTYTGPTNVFEGTLYGGAANALPASTVLHLGSATGVTVGATTYGANASATFDLNGHDQTIAGVAEGGTGTKSITNSSTTAATLRVNVPSGTNAFNSVISGNMGLTAGGPGTFQLNGVNTYAGLTTVSGGALVVGATGSIASTSGVHLDRGAGLMLKSATDITALAGKVTASAADSTGNHSVQTMTAHAALVNGNSTGFAYSGGPAVTDSTDVLYLYGWNGDLNMDGKVDYLDYGVIDNNYLTHPDPGPGSYPKGDLTGDGVINYLDYGMMDNAYLAQTAPHSAAMAAASAAALSSSAVPEPGALGLLGIGALGLLARRRVRK